MQKRKALVWIVVISLLVGGINIIFTPSSLAEDEGIDKIINDKNTNSYEEGLLNGSWPMHRHDRKRTGQSPYSTNKTEDFVEWTFSASGDISASPVVGNETIYIGSEDKNLYALDKEGKLKWKFTTGNIILSSLVLDEKGNAYFGSGDQKVYALTSNGTLKWSYNTGGYITSSPAIGRNGTIYVSSYGGLFALSQNGTLKWEKNIGVISQSSPTIDENGNIYVIKKYPGKLYSFKSDGSKRWIYNLDEKDVISTPVIDQGETIYINSNGKNLYAINPNGTLNWSVKQDQGNNLMAATSGRGLALSNDGTIYFGSAYNTLYAIQKNGTEKWNLTFDGSIEYSSPSIGKNGILYLGSFDQNVYAVNPNGTIRWTYKTGDKIYSSPAIDDGGTVYIGSMNDNLYAFTGKAPEIKDKTMDLVNTSETLEINAEITDNRKVETVHLTYWFGEDDSNKKKEKMDHDENDTYLKEIDIPSNSTEELHYRIKAEDDFGNENETDMKTVVVKDAISPVARAGNDRTLGVNEETAFDASNSMDNIGIVDHIWTIESSKYHQEKINYSFEIPGEYEIKLKVKDAAGNHDIDKVNVTVVDETDPIADAGSDRTVIEDTEITFDASNSSDNVEIVNYTWVIQGNEYFGEEIEYIFTDPGDYMVTLNVSDTAGNWDTDAVAVEVKDTTPPVTDAGEDKTVDEDTVVVLNASKSSDNGGIANYTWTIEGTEYYGKTVEYVFAHPGYYPVELNVTDEAGNYDTDIANVTVNDVTDPTADAGEDKTVDEDTVVTFDGSNSSDNVGIVNYTWLIEGSEYYDKVVSHEFKDPGEFTVELNVSDASCNYDVDKVQVTVNDTTQPNAEAGDNRTVDAGSPIEFNANGSTDNVGIVNYTWFIEGNEYFGFSIIHEFMEVGEFKVTLTVKDAAGNEDTDTITVKAEDGIAPVADAGDDRTVDEDVEITLDGSNSSDNLDISEYKWTIENSTHYGEILKYIFEDPGEYTVKLNVTDESGNWDTDKANITVRDQTPPKANGGGDRLAKLGTNTTFDGSNSTDNGEIVNYTWIIRRGKNGKKIATLSGEKVNYTFEKRGVMYVTLIVEDSGNNTDRDTFRVGVNNRIPSPGILPFLFIVIGAALIWKFKEKG